MASPPTDKELSVAGAAFIQTLIGAANFQRLLQLQTVYQFDTIRDCVEWLLNNNQYSVSEDDENVAAAEIQNDGFMQTSVSNGEQHTASKVSQRRTKDLKREQKISYENNTEKAELPGDIVVKREAEEMRGDCLEHAEDELVEALPSSELDFETTLQLNRPSTVEAAGGKENAVVQCSLCPMQFADNYKLQRHQQVHTGERPFQCNVCHRAFRRKHVLASHYRTHTGEKPFTCDICKKTFNQKISLVEHYRIHTGDKPYSCTVCFKTFRYRRAYTRHLVVHPIQTVTNSSMVSSELMQTPDSQHAVVNAPGTLSQPISQCPPASLHHATLMQ